MAEILPFRALRYDPNQVVLDDVVTQPYDKISPALQDKYYERNPHNLVRVLLGKPGETDNHNFNIYTRAAEYLHDWRSAGILRHDLDASFYVYSQTFSIPGMRELAERRGLIALGRIQDYSDGVVFRHEQVLAKPWTDRLRLLRTTRAHLGQILMLYSDPQSSIERFLNTDEEPAIAVLDDREVLHRLWPLHDPEIVASIQRSMKDKKLLIADGHHLYDTALAYRNEQRQEAGSTDPDAPYEFAMMTFVRLETHGLVVLPNHRIVHGLPSFDRERMLEGASRFFDIDRIDLRTEGRSATTVLEEAGTKGTAFVAVTRQGPYLMRARHGPVQEALRNLSERQRTVDVVQLHKLMLQRVLGITDEAVFNEEYLRYESDASEAISWVRQGANVAFLLNAAHIEQVRELAMNGEVLPQRSTDFYPTLLSGLSIYALD